MNWQVYVLIASAAMVPLACGPDVNVTRALDGPADRVAYVSFRPGNWDVYILDGPDTDPRQLTHYAGLDYNPTISPDGRWIVFCSERRGNPDLFALDLDAGGPPRLLILSEAMEDQPAFSPDGRTLAFVSSHDGQADLYTLPFRPGETQSMDQATRLTDDPGGDFRPAFSPDGTRLAFSSDRGSVIDNSIPLARIRSGNIFVLDVAAGSIQQLTDEPGWDGSPSWSADGRQVVFYSQRDTKPSGFDPRAFVWIMNADGSEQRLVSSVDSVAVSPVFTPDGRIAYAARRDEDGGRRWSIVSIQADGSDRRIESDTTRDYWKPAFHPQTNALLVYGAGPAARPASARSAPGRPAYIGEGPLLTTGAPYRRALPDRLIDVYPLRTFTASLHPTRDSLLYTDLPGPSLFLSTSDGTDRQLVHRFDPPQAPWLGFAWSRTARWIFYTKGDHFSPPDAEADVWKMRPDGSDAVNLTPDSPGNDGFPSVSGDGSLVTFRSGRTGNFDVYIMNADGTEPRNVTEHPASDLFPVFSPTDQRIAFLSDRDSLGSRVYELYLLELDLDVHPRELRRVTHNTVQEGHPEFSPDGKWLIYASEKGGINDEEPLVQSVLFAPQMYGEMYAYHVNDRVTVRLTHDKWEDGFPSWGVPLVP